MTILDKFSRESFRVETTWGEINPPGWTRPAFATFFDLNISRWILVHRATCHIFAPHFPSIEAACTAILEIETIPFDWFEKDDPPLDVQLRAIEILWRYAKEPNPKLTFANIIQHDLKATS